MVFFFSVFFWLPLFLVSGLQHFIPFKKRLSIPPSNLVVMLIKIKTQPKIQHRQLYASSDRRALHVRFFCSAWYPMSQIKMLCNTYLITSLWVSSQLVFVLFICFIISAYLYKCWVSRTDCSTCHNDVKAEPNLRCGWCKAGTPRCVVRKACNDVNNWVPFTSRCLTTPNITKVSILHYILLGHKSNWGLIVTSGTLLTVTCIIIKSFLDNILNLLHSCINKSRRNLVCTCD